MHTEASIPNRCLGTALQGAHAPQPKLACLTVWLVLA